MQKKKRQKVQVRDLKPRKNVKGGKGNFSDLNVTQVRDKGSP